MSKTFCYVWLKYSVSCPPTVTIFLRPSLTLFRVRIDFSSVIDCFTSCQSDNIVDLNNFWVDFSSLTALYCCSYELLKDIHISDSFKEKHRSLYVISISNYIYILSLSSSVNSSVFIATKKKNPWFNVGLVIACCSAIARSPMFFCFWQKKEELFISVNIYLII